MSVDSSSRPRFQRRPPNRFGPKRSAHADVSETDSVSETIEEAVSRAYGIVEDHIRKGQEAAARHNQHNHGSTHMYHDPYYAQPQANNGSIPMVVMQQWLQAMQTWTSMWMQMLPMLGGMQQPQGMMGHPPAGMGGMYAGMHAMPPMPPMPPMPDGMTPDMAMAAMSAFGGSQSGEAPPNYQTHPGFQAAPTSLANPTHVSVLLDTRRTCEVIANIGPCHYATELLIEPLHAVEVDASALIATATCDETGRLQITVTVPERQTGGQYTGVVRGTDGAPLGDLTVNVAE